MINIPLPPDIEPQFEWLRELMNYSQLMGELICIAEKQHKTCEFAKAIQEQDEETAYYQLCGAIQELYNREKERLNTRQLSTVLDESIWNTLKQRD